MNRPAHFHPTVQRGDIAALYRSRATDPLFWLLGDAYQPPTIFEHGRRTLVAEMPATHEDGRPVRIFESRWPARFYSLESHGFRLNTGSGEDGAHLLFAVARQIAGGMLAIEAIPLPEGEG